LFWTAQQQQKTLANKLGQMLAICKCFASQGDAIFGRLLLADREKVYLFRSFVLLYKQSRMTNTFSLVRTFRTLVRMAFCPPGSSTSCCLLQLLGL